MNLSTNEKVALLEKAADIAVQAAKETIVPDALAKIIETTYNKMLELAEKA